MCPERLFNPAFRGCQNPINGLLSSSLYSVSQKDADVGCNFNTYGSILIVFWQAYCYKQFSIPAIASDVARSVVCLSVGHNRRPCKDG